MLDVRAKLSRASSAKPQALFRLLLIYPDAEEITPITYHIYHIYRVYHIYHVYHIDSYLIYMYIYHLSI